MEEIIVANLTLDTYQRNKVAPLVVPHGDYGARVIRAKITDLGKPVIVESTAAVSIVATRSGDGESQAFSGSVNADGTVTVPVTQWMLDVPEEDVTCHVVVTGIGYQYSTTSFLIEPQAKATPTEIAPDDPRQDLVTEVLAGENTRRAAEAERLSNENARIAAENARQSAEEQRVTYESTRITNEAKRVSAESSRDATFRSWAQDIASLPTFDGRISANRKRIENLESGIPAESFIIDDSVAYTKDVPENVAPNAVLQKVGGMTRKCANLIPYPYAETTNTVNGVTFTDNGDGTITINGTATEAISFTFGRFAVTPKQACFFRVIPISGGFSSIYAYIYTDSSDEVYDFGSGAQFTPNNNLASASMVVVKEQTFNNLIVKPMLNAGSTALPYEPYFEGLRSAKVTEVKSVGVNLLPFPYNQSMVTNNGVTYTVNADGSVLANGTATEYTNAVIYLARNFVLPAGTYTFVFNETVIQGAVMAVMINGAWFGDVSTHRTITLKSGDELTIYLQVVGGVSVTNLLLKPRINKGATAQPCTPYVEHTLPIPEAARPANGINENVYDYIEWAEDGSVKKTVKCGVVDMGTIGWAYNNDSAWWYSNALKSVMAINYNAPPLLAENYKTTAWADKATGTINQDGSGNLIVLSNDSTTKPSGLLYYELAEPIVTDISDLITADNLIGVEGGGTLTFENEYGYDVPSTIIYQSR